LIFFKAARTVHTHGVPPHGSQGAGLDRGYSAHSMRATFITTTLENGASLEEVQKAAGHRDPGTTKLYDRRSYNPEKAASHRANY
jgi:integrase/recombinase XerD